MREWHCVAFVPDYSGGSTVDSHHLPFRPHKSGYRQPRPIHLSKHRRTRSAMAQLI